MLREGFAVATARGATRPAREVAARRSACAVTGTSSSTPCRAGTTGPTRRPSRSGRRRDAAHAARQLPKVRVRARAGDLQTRRSSPRKLEQRRDPATRQSPAPRLGSQRDRSRHGDACSPGRGREHRGGHGRRHGPHRERRRSGLSVERAELPDDELGSRSTIEAPPEPLALDLDAQALPPEPGVPRPLVDLRGHLVEGVHERGIGDGDRRHHLRAEETRVQPAKSSDRAEAAARVRGRRDGRSPVRLHAELIGRVGERAPGRREGDRLRLDSREPPLELRHGRVLAQASDVDPGDPCSGRELVLLPGEGETEERGDEEHDDPRQGSLQRHRTATSPPAHTRSREGRLGTHGPRILPPRNENLG